jgi:UDP-N-acetylmuramyl pentapeptide synthase
VGRAAARSGIAALVAVRGQARHIAEEASRTGLPASSVHFFEDAPAAGDFLVALVRPEDAVLFKASRGVGLERALQRLLASVEARAFSGSSL